MADTATKAGKSPRKRQKTAKGPVNKRSAPREQDGGAAAPRVPIGHRRRWRWRPAAGQAGLTLRRCTLSTLTNTIAISLHVLLVMPVQQARIRNGQKTFPPAELGVLDSRGGTKGRVKVGPLFVY